MHNLYTPRGAQVRDALGWSKYIGEAIELFGDDTDMCFASHHWPRWGRDDARDFLVRSATSTAGCTTRRCASPTTADRHRDRRAARAAARGAANGDVPGLLRHGQPQREGGLPALPRLVRRQPGHLHPLPPVEAAVRYVEYMGGADAVLDRGPGQRPRRGDYRWVAQVVNHVVFADPTTPRPASCRPTRSSSSATRPSPARGATST
jgi:hypothetical protein